MIPHDFRPPRYRVKKWHRVGEIALPTVKQSLQFGRRNDQDWGTNPASERDWNKCHAWAGTGTFTEGVFYSNKAAFNAVNTTTSETSLLVGNNQGLQPTIPGNNPLAGYDAWPRVISFKGWGLMGSTSTPTYTFKFYLATSLAALSGLTIGSTAAITAASSVTNKLWTFWLDLLVQAPGQGAGNCTLFAAGEITCPAGFASPFTYSITPGGGDSATVTGTLDGSVTQYFNMSVTPSASNAANTVTLNMLQGIAWN